MSTQRFPLDTLRREVARLGLSVDETVYEKFERYLALLLEWNDRAGLTAILDPATIEQRHFGESLALLVALRDAGFVPLGASLKIADIGTGAGFPGLPMRLAAPELQLTLVESNGKRCQFLSAACEELEVIDVRVVQARVEEAGRDPALRGQFDLVVARALAALPTLVEYALPLLREGGILAAPKGSRGSDEMNEAAASIAALGGVSDVPLLLPLPEGVPPQQVLVVRRVHPLDDRFPRRPGIPLKRPLR